MAQSLTNLLYHIVFSTKDRQPLIAAAYRARLYGYVGGIVRNAGGVALAINGMPDHLHLLVKLRQDPSVSTVIRDVKANSSRWLREQGNESRQFAWQRGYGAFTVSESQVERVTRYIADQQRHHRAMSFQDEFLALLRAHRVEFSEQYLWH